ncbi:MAG: outer membrane protein assembly factor BamD [Puniceicoccales bacterium]|jgi:outer membrane protein assembly factor BamD|nr:outer membrane protein assembly factor BamD [Puniceicoccales bacterium]
MGSGNHKVVTIEDVMRKFTLIFVLAFAGYALHGELLWNRQEGWHSGPNDAAKLESGDFAAREIMNQAGLEQEEGRAQNALKIYDDVCKQYANSIFAPEAYYQIGKIRKQKHQYKHAFKAFDAIITKYPQYPGFNKVVREQFDLATLLKGGSRPYYFGVIPGFRDYVSAIEFYENIIKHAPYDDLAPLALVNISELALKEKKPVEAIDALDRLIDGYPDSEYSPYAYLKIAKIYSSMVKSVKNDQGATQEAMHYYEDFLILYPTHDLAGEARRGLDDMKTQLAMSKVNVGDFYFQSRNNPEAAVIMYGEAIKCYPESKAAALANEKINYIKEGNLPRKTPVDFMFGRYKRPSEKLLAEDVEGDATGTVPVRE